MPQLPIQRQEDFISGVVTNVNESIRPRNSVAFAMNMDFDHELGAAVSRLGTGLINAQVVDGKTCLGLHNFRDSVGTGHKLFVAMNIANDATSSVYDAETGSAVTGATGLTASTKIRFLTYLDSCLMINGVDAERAWNGAAIITTGGAFDLGNIPGSNALKYAIEWQDRVYLAGDTAAGASDRVYYSSTPTASAVSWTSGNGNFDLEPEDGGGTITGFGKVPGYLLIFKERSMKRFNFVSAFPETLDQIGTPSQASVITAQGICAFFSASSREAKGFYITNGGRPISISHDRAKSIKKWVDAIPQAYEDDVSGWGNERYFYWSIGDVTVDGIAYTNVVLKYHRGLDQWSIRSYPSEFRYFSSFVSSGNNVLVGGDDDGCVIEIDKASTYQDYNPATAASVPIHWEVRTHDEDFRYYNIKNVSESVVVNSRGAQGARVQMATDQSVEGNYYDRLKNVGEITKDYSELTLKEALKGSRFSTTIKGFQIGNRATIKGIEFPNVEVLPNYK